MKSLFKSGLVLFFYSSVIVQASPVVHVAAGGGFGLFLKADGSLWGMGYNHYGVFDTTFNNAIRPEQLVGSNVTAVAGCNGVFCEIGRECLGDGRR